MNASPRRRYARSPVVEAILDVQVEDLSSSVIPRFRAYENVEYPARDEVIVSGAEAEADSDGVATRSVRRLIGIRHGTENGHQNAQLRTDGFMFARLEPYDCWENFFADARSMWSAYLDLAEEVNLIQVGMRYVNLIEIGSEAVDLDDYLQTKPEIAANLPDATSGFFFSIDIPMPQFRATTRIIETVVPRAPARSSPQLVLDIFAFRSLDQTSIATSSALDEFDDVCDDLHEAATLAFESSITDKARENFR